MIYHTWERRRTGRVTDQGTDREKRPSAESCFGENICEVHPGVDPVKGISTVAGYGITHVTCIKVEGDLYESGTAE